MKSSALQAFVGAKRDAKPIFNLHRQSNRALNDMLSCKTAFYGLGMRAAAKLAAKFVTDRKCDMSQKEGFACGLIPVSAGTWASA